MGRAAGRIARWLVRSHALPAAAACAVMACDGSVTTITPFPIAVDPSSVAIMVGVDLDRAGAPVPAVIDTMSPLTVVDPMILDEPRARPRRRGHELTIYSAGAGEPVAQARFPGVGTLEIQTCAGTADDGDGACVLGFEGEERPIPVILGADLWARGAIRFAFADDQISLFPDISGSNQARARLCETVFPEPFYGGGTLLVGGAEVSFNGRRIAVGACLLAESASGGTGDLACPIDPDAGGPDAGGPAPLPDPGALSALFVISTGVPISVVSASFFDRYRTACAALGVSCDTELGAAETLHLASGPITVRRAAIMDLALVGEFSDERGPCQELYANAYMRRCGNCVSPAQDACPCDDDDDFCRAGAAVTLRHAIEVAVVADTSVLLQALRDELRPALPELDGILAPSALEPLVVDVDYTNNRVIARCDPERTDVCTTLPAVIDEDTRDETRSYCPSL